MESRKILPERKQEAKMFVGRKRKGSNIPWKEEEKKMSLELKYWIKRSTEGKGKLKYIQGGKGRLSYHKEKLEKRFKKTPPEWASKANMSAIKMFAAETFLLFIPICSL
jgi:hypothetical protein